MLEVTRGRLDRALRFLLPALGIAVPSLLSALPVRTTPGTTPAASTGRVLMGRDLLLALHRRVPAFSRQTKLACSACHYQFPQLTPFGRLFKLNGYTMTGLQTIEGRTDSTSESLKLAPIPPAAVMVIASATQTNTAVPGTQNTTAQFPQQFSVFLAGQVTPNVGAFTQFTYAGADGSFGIDNVDIRYASHHQVGGKDLILGLTGHNNPTVQDVWNTLPAWGYPFISAEAAPGAGAATILEGALAQSVFGLGAYSLWDNLLYAEVTAYRSSPQGAVVPLDSTAKNAMSGVAPYWRVALQHQLSSTYVEVGTFGLVSKLYPTGVTGLTNKYSDAGVDAQIEHPVGTGTLIGRTSYIFENQTLNAASAAGESEFGTNHLQSFHINASYLPNLRYSFTLGYNAINGGSDTLLYAPAPVTGFAGTPNSSNVTAEFNFNAWENTRVGVQYVAWQKFNGASTNYDQAGRNASGNNTLFAYFWVAF